MIAFSRPRDPDRVDLPRDVLLPVDPPRQELQLRGHFPLQQGVEGPRPDAFAHDLHLPAAGVSQHFRRSPQSLSCLEFLHQLHNKEN